MTELYLLDRNIIDLMNKHNNSSNIPEPNRIDMLNKLKALDIKGNTFSPLLSIIEGKTHKKLDSNGKLEIIKTPNKKIRKLIIEDSEIVKSFIKEANTDYDFLTSNVNKLSKIIYEKETDRLIDKKTKFLDKLQEKIGETKKVEQRENTYYEFKEIVNEFNEFKNQPFTIVALMYIFGSQRAEKILKFKSKNFSSYNPIADFNHYKTTIQLRFDDRLKDNANIHFISLDSDIEFIQHLFHPNNAKISSSTNYTNTLAIEWTINKNFLQSEIPETKGELNNQELFYSCFQDLYGYDARVS
ncbi:TPA: hypothetical protein ACH7US_004745 [Escherichia coli]